MARTPQGNDRDQMKAVAAGEGDLAVVNTYYVGRLIDSGDEYEREVGAQVRVFFPNQEDRGAHVNVSGAGVAVSAKNRDNAVRLLEFLTAPEAQEKFSAANYEYPVNPAVTPSPLLQSWGGFTADDLPLNRPRRAQRRRGAGLRPGRLAVARAMRPVPVGLRRFLRSGVDGTRTPRGPGSRARVSRGWLAAPVTAAILIGTPLLVVIANLDGFLSAEMGHLARTVLPGYTVTTIALVALVAALCALVGVVAAWLVTAYDFPGRRALGWLLVLPLAIPTYIGALAYAGIFDYTGPAQLLFREVLQVPAGAYPILRVRGFGGLTFVLATLLYPYVYLTARAAFARQGATLLEVSRSLGRSRAEAFVHAVLPATRPALAAGVMLVVMETLGEFGASHYLGVDTLTIGIFRSWFGLGSVRVALALGALLLLIVALLQAVEHRQRGAARFHDAALHDRPLVRRKLRGAAALGACAVCSVPVITGFALPVGQLMWWAARRLPGFDLELVRLTAASIGLAAAATAATVTLAVLVAYAGPGAQGPPGRRACPVVGLRLCGPGGGAGRRYRHRLDLGRPPAEQRGVRPVRFRAGPAAHRLRPGVDGRVRGALLRAGVSLDRCRFHKDPAAVRRGWAGCSAWGRGAACCTSPCRTCAPP